MSCTPTPELLVIRGLIASLPEEDRKKVEACSHAIRNTLAAHNYQAAIMALTLVTAEETAK